LTSISLFFDVIYFGLLTNVLLLLF